MASSEDDRLVGGSRRSRWNRSRGPTADYARDVWARLQEFMLRRRSVQAPAAAPEAELTTDAGYDALFQELIATDGELRVGRERGGVPA